MRADPPFDYAAWVERARRFVEELARVPGTDIRSTAVAPLAASAQLAAVEQQLGLTLPGSLRAFFTLGSAGVDCHYAYEPGDGVLGNILPDENRIFGGARLGPLSELPAFARSAAEWAAETWVAEVPDQQALWTSALPFARMDNGDYLAVALGGPDPPVVYLNHDDDSSVIAPSLAEFLHAWERLAYLGPEHWLLLAFVDGRGQLDAESDRAARLRGLLLL
jgi:hypothetical protein